MARTLEVPMERPVSPVRKPVTRPVPRGMALDAEILEAVAVVLLQNCTPGKVVRQSGLDLKATARKTRADRLDQRLAECGGWDEV